jgi:hypothetical protein
VTPNQQIELTGWILVPKVGYQHPGVATGQEGDRAQSPEAHLGRYMR